MYVKHEKTPIYGVKCRYRENGHDGIPYKFVHNAVIHTYQRFHLAKIGINEIEVEADSITVYDLLIRAENQIEKKFIDQLIDTEQQIISGTMILINGRNVIHLDNINSIVRSDDEISIFPPGGGG